MDDLAPKTYDTPLTPDELKAFGMWRSNLPENLRGSADYDLQGAYKAGLTPGQNGHLPDTFKKPSHMTFSNESIYSGVDGNQGGEWSQDENGHWSFAPGPTNLANHTPEELKSYFDTYEPDATLMLPQKSALDVLFPPGKK